MTGGSTASGGTTAIGGSAVTGGSTASGGTTATGGSAVTGGSSGTDASGGTLPTGGTDASGGTGTGGEVASGGTVSTGGSGGDATCGTKTTSDCSQSGTTCSLNVDGTDRTFYVQLPDNYDPSTPYRVIFQFHPMGGSAEGSLTMYNLRSRIPDAIYVSPQGLASSGTTGWPNTNGQDVNFTKAMLDYLETNFCVDRSRIFSTGFSYGGIMSLTLGCQMSDVFRAIAPESGMLIGGSCNPTHPVAVWQSNGDSDETVTPESAASARDNFVQANGCSSTTHAVDPSPCVAYDGCADGYPVTWCLFSGGHALPSFGPDAIADFFMQF